jgi:glycosyltransferase involved in cell wall biosynthesis
LKLKLFIIGSAGIPAKYGGFETFAENLSLHLSLDFDIYVACSSKIYEPENRQKKWNNINRIFVHFWPNGVQSLVYDFFSLLNALTKADFIIMLGSGSGIIIPFFSIFKKLPLAVHIDGIEWKREKWNRFARIFLWLNYRLCLRFSKYIILDNETLIKNIPEKFRDKLVRITYGWEHLPVIEPNPSIAKMPYALVISRAEPENNLEMIINAFTAINNLELIVISNCESTKFGRSMLRKFKCNSNIKLIGPIYENKELLQQYRMGCSVYIHGHSAGGTNPSLIEAMATGKPILALDNGFNRITTNNHAFYFDNTLTLNSLLIKIGDESFLKSAE